jgi:hypothetical protein
MLSKGESDEEEEEQTGEKISVDIAKTKSE